MWGQADEILRQSTARIAEHVADFLPGLLVATMLMFGTLVVAAIVRVLLLRVLKRVDFDRRANQLGFGTPLTGLPTDLSQTAARTVFWMVVLLGLLVSLTALNATIPSRLALSVFEYVPHLAAALLILLAGAIAARFLARSVLINAVNMHIQSARFLSLGVKWLVLLVAVAMALDHLGIGRSVLLLAFGILFGGVVFAASLAVGLGARDAVSRTISRQLETPAGTDEKIDHV